jgi:hypothetical protein
MEGLGIDSDDDVYGNVFKEGDKVDVFFDRNISPPGWH